MSYTVIALGVLALGLVYTVLSIRGLRKDMKSLEWLINDVKETGNNTRDIAYDARSKATYSIGVHPNHQFAVSSVISHILEHLGLKLIRKESTMELVKKEGK